MNLNLKALKVELCVYIAIGVLWSLTFGIWTITLREELGDHEYYDEIASITSAWLTGEGTLIICTEGYRGVRGKTTAKPKPFSISIPIEATWTGAEGSARSEAGIDGLISPELHVARSWISDGCPGVRATDALVPLVRLPATRPHDFFDGMDAYALKQLRVTSGHKYEIYEVPVSSDAAHFDQYKQIICVGLASNPSGQHAYVLRIDPVRKRGTVAFWRWPIAIAIDIIIWPVEIAMWAGAHS